MHIEQDSMSAGFRGMRLLALALVAATTTGCTINSGLRNQIDRGDVPPIPGLEVVQVTAEVLVGNAQSAPVAREIPEGLRPLGSEGDSYTYRVGVGDVLRVVVWEHPELNNPSGQSQGDAASAGRLVEADGTLYFPYIGNVKAAGLTSGELRAQIAQKLGKFIRDPQIDVRVTEFRSQRVYVTGEVAAPNAVYLTDTVHGVLDAITSAGGFTTLSNRYLVRLTRDGVTTELPIGELRRGDIRANVRLQAGDLINVPDVSEDKVFLLGEFAAQKTLIRQRAEMSLAEALTQGGGLDKAGANPRAVFVFRRNPEPAPSVAGTRANPLPKVYLLDMTRAESLLLAERFPLESRDVVYVAATDFSKYNRLLNQLLPTVSAYFQLDRLIND
ncbi:hypothetical protein D0B54_14970 [Solimonas sp. K1W22B-7]|uniref:polysaccharide biosynthesis/export family protein n=1 Tax=Solimonas sp. K1W22B-7 TaxID=2303331 RepID=UPI000E337060|nr:polysaccharide biosynthesis/export family protein [Solimonas sp. K1W22B-7]AXQ29899.1 hypothetical protein D0B54_14970 [Solimonas sp. K1W22B-7]